MYANLQNFSLLNFTLEGKFQIRNEDNARASGKLTTDIKQKTPRKNFLDLTGDIRLFSFFSSRPERNALNFSSAPRDHRLNHENEGGKNSVQGVF